MGGRRGGGLDRTTGGGAGRAHAGWEGHARRPAGRRSRRRRLTDGEPRGLRAPAARDEGRRTGNRGDRRRSRRPLTALPDPFSRDRASPTPPRRTRAGSAAPEAGPDDRAARGAGDGYDAGAVTEVLGVFLAALAVVGLSIFLLGLGSLLKRRCSLRPCGSREEAGDACAECPLAKPERTEPA